MTTTKLIHCDSEKHLLYIARVSSNQDNTDPGLIQFLIKQNHWSPFEMIGACIEINTTRDIGRQILRHRSFSFQEFSQRYAEVQHEETFRAVRFKGSSNRQGSLDPHGSTEIMLATNMMEAMQEHARAAFELYSTMIEQGVAPECARAVLPEGMTPTRMYMHGTLRSWIHYLRERMKLDPTGVPYAQREHFLIAEQIADILCGLYPNTFDALRRLGYVDGMGARNPE